MCIGAGEEQSAEEEVIAEVQDNILHAYNLWKQSYEWFFTDEELKEMSEEEMVNDFLMQVKELIMNKG